MLFCVVVDKLCEMKCEIKKDKSNILEQFWENEILSWIWILNLSGSLKDINLFDVMLPWGAFCCMFWIIVSSALKDYSTLPFRVWAPSLFFKFSRRIPKRQYCRHQNSLKE